MQVSCLKHAKIWKFKNSFQILAVDECLVVGAVKTRGNCFKVEMRGWPSRQKNGKGRLSHKLRTELRNGEFGFRKVAHEHWMGFTNIDLVSVAGCLLCRLLDGYDGRGFGVPWAKKTAIPVWEGSQETHHQLRLHHQNYVRPATTMTSTTNQPQCFVGSLSCFGCWMVMWIVRILKYPIFYQLNTPVMAS